MLWMISIRNSIDQIKSIAMESHLSIEILLIEILHLNMLLSIYIGKLLEKITKLVKNPLL